LSIGRPAISGPARASVRVPRAATGSDGGLGTSPRHAPGASGACGFTLAEVVVAVFVMGLALMAAVPLFSYAMRETAVGADLGSVGAAAVDRMELLRQIDFNTLAAGGNLASNDTGFSDTTGPKAIVRWQIVANGPPATLKTITVRAIAKRTSIGQKEILVTTVRAR
jgi:prepilin-type N-terminal cleavage/methylation domain-containing protein